MHSAVLVEDERARPTPRPHTLEYRVYKFGTIFLYQKRASFVHEN